LETVNRDSRFTKIHSLIENSEYFFDEILYYKDSPTLRWLSNLNYHYIELFIFLLTFALNFILLNVVEPASEHTASASNSTASNATNSTSHGRLLLRYLSEATSNSTSSTTTQGNDWIDYTAYALCGIQGLISLVSIIIWSLAKLPLYYFIEKKQYSRKKDIKIDEIGFFSKIYLFIIRSIILRNEMNTMVFNLVFIIISISNKDDTFSNSVQLLLIINLSETLKNIIKSVTFRWIQLLSTSLFVIICVNIFSMIAFFFLRNHYKEVNKGLNIATRRCLRNPSLLLHYSP
jgi:hypothetical protein